MNSARNRSVSTPHNAGESFSSSRIRGRRLILPAPSGARSLRPECYYGTARQIPPSEEGSASVRGSSFLHVGGLLSNQQIGPGKFLALATRRGTRSGLIGA